MTAPNQNDIDRGAQAMKNFVVSVNWKGNFVPWDDYEQGARFVIGEFDAGKNVGQCGQELFDFISKQGYGDQVSLEQCTDAAGAVLAAVGLVKSRQA